MSDTECKNPGQADYLTCPACYHDHHHIKQPDSLTACEGCGTAIICAVEYEPVSVFRLADEDEQAEQQ